MPSMYIEPFDLKTLLVDFFLGSGDLFAFAFILVYSLAAAKFGFSNKLYFILLIIGGVIFSATLASGWFMVIAMGIGAFVFGRLGKVFR